MNGPSLAGKRSRPRKPLPLHHPGRPGEAETAEVVAPKPACLAGMRALVVDDNATNRRILDEILRSWRMTPTLARNAGEALNFMRQAYAAGQPYRLVLTDAHMPGTDGFAFVEEVRHDTDMDGTVVMMLTSGDCPDDAARCEKLGIGAYLLKPIKESELLEAVNLALGIAGAQRAARACDAARRPRRRVAGSVGRRQPCQSEIGRRPAGKRGA